MALSAYSRIEARSKINDLCFQFKKKEKKEQIKSKQTNKKGYNKKSVREKMKKLNETKSLFFE